MVENILGRVNWLTRNSNHKNKVLYDEVDNEVIRNVRQKMMKAGGRMTEIAKLYTDHVSVHVVYNPQRFLREECATMTFNFRGDERGVSIQLICKRGKRPVLIESVIGWSESMTPVRDFGEKLRGPQYASERELEALSGVLSWLGPDTNQ